MARITSKLQVTIPKAIADRYGIKPGDEVEFREAGDVIRVVPPGAQATRAPAIDERLLLFDRATERQARRQRGKRSSKARGRGWTREDLYERGRSG